MALPHRFAQTSFPPHSPLPTPGTVRDSPQIFSIYPYLVNFQKQIPIPPLPYSSLAQRHFNINQQASFAAAKSAMLSWLNLAREAVI